MDTATTTAERAIPWNKDKLLGPSYERETKRLPSDTGRIPATTTVTLYAAQHAGPINERHVGGLNLRTDAHGYIVTGATLRVSVFGMNPIAPRSSACRIVTWSLLAESITTDTDGWRSQISASTSKPSRSGR